MKTEKPPYKSEMTEEEALEWILHNEGERLGYTEKKIGTANYLALRHKGYICEVHPAGGYNHYTLTRKAKKLLTKKELVKNSFTVQINHMSTDNITVEDIIKAVEKYFAKMENIEIKAIDVTGKIILY
jgi:hypothetical protein